MTVRCWAILKHGMQMVAPFSYLWCQLELGTVELFSAIINNNYKYIWFQSPDGHYIACGAIDGIINIFDLTTGKLLHTLEGEKWKIYVRKKFMQAYFFDFFCLFCRSCHAYQIFNILTWLPTVDYSFWWQPHQDVWCVPFRALTSLS